MSSKRKLVKRVCFTIVFRLILAWTRQWHRVKSDRQVCDWVSGGQKVIRQVDLTRFPRAKCIGRRRSELRKSERERKRERSAIWRVGLRLIQKGDAIICRIGQIDCLRSINKRRNIEKTAGGIWNTIKRMDDDDDDDDGQVCTLNEQMMGRWKGSVWKSFELNDKSVF